jgi:hypothetical protein
MYRTDRPAGQDVTAFDLLEAPYSSVANLGACDRQALERQ